MNHPNSNVSLTGKKNPKHQFLADQHVSSLNSENKSVRCPLHRYGNRAWKVWHMSERHTEVAETEFTDAYVFLACHIGVKSKEL